MRSLSWVIFVAHSCVVYTIVSFVHELSKSMLNVRDYYGEVGRGRRAQQGSLAVLLPVRRESESQAIPAISAGTQVLHQQRQLKLRRKLRFRRNGACMCVCKKSPAAQVQNGVSRVRIVLWGTLLLLVVVVLLTSFERTAHHRYT